MIAVSQSFFLNLAGGKIYIDGIFLIVKARGTVLVCDLKNPTFYLKIYCKIV